jgi:hypothetical protein
MEFTGFCRLSRLVIVHVEKFGRFDVDAVLKSLFMCLCELSDDISNRLDSEITKKVTISNVPCCVNSTLQHFVLVAQNHLNIRITGAAPQLDTITPNWMQNLLV